MSLLDWLPTLSPAAALVFFIVLTLAWILGLIYACVYLEPAARSQPPRRR